MTDYWLNAIDDLLADRSKGEPLTCKEAELGVASDSLLLSQEDIYQLDDGFEDSDTELI